MMSFTLKTIAAVAALLPAIDAQTVSLYQQCGGTTYTGATKCQSTATCTTWNPYYAQCVPYTGPYTVTVTQTAAAPPASTVTVTATTTAAGSCSGSARPASSSSVAPSSSCAPPSASPTKKLNKLARAKGLKFGFGTATDYYEYENDAPYKAITQDKDLFGIITPLNSMKWESTEPANNTFTFANGDKVAAFAAANGQDLHCHTLVWHSQLPNWVSQGTWTNETLIAVMKNHVYSLVNHWKGKCKVWDVVNEAFNEDGTYRKSVFSDVIGPAFIPLAFQFAQEADPNVILLYNDYNLDNRGPKSTAALNVYKDLKARGIRIDGIGAQAHFQSLQVGNTVKENWQDFAAAGADIYITELDIRIALPPTPEKLATQKAEYKYITDACFSNPKCVSFQIWDWTDKYSWVPSVFTGYGAALPWSNATETCGNYYPKPAYYGMEEVIAA